ncbi:hypothetical protein ON010_g7433 [Phytophthora cinnamomi]|nr:hypothetical protein ON010_g7433 [Phytophthora cinnamomi]
MVKVLDPASAVLAQMAKDVNAVRAKEMSIRQAANSYGVDKSSLHRGVKDQVPINARPGPSPILTKEKFKASLTLSTPVTTEVSALHQPSRLCSSAKWLSEARIHEKYRRPFRRRAE